MAKHVAVEPGESSMRPFFIVWGGQAVSLLGSQLVQFAIVWWLTKTTGSATVLALATLVALLPQIAIGPFAGALIDRWKRRTVMIVADAAVALSTLVLVLLFWRNQASIIAIYVLLLIRATGGAFHWPAMQASTTLMVPGRHLARVGGMNQALSGIAGILIPPLGALAVEALPMQTVLAVDVITALPAIGTLLFISIPQPEKTAAQETGAVSMLSEMRQALRFILNWKALLHLSLVGLAVGVLSRAGASIIPLMITQYFGGGARELGWWESGYGAGLVAGGLILGAWGGFRRRIATSMLSLALDGLVCIFIALAPPGLFVLTIAFMGALGILESFVFGINGAIGQAVVPPEMQGRVFALIISASQLAAPLGLLVVGPFVDAFGVRTWWFISASIILITGVAALLSPALMHIEDGPPANMLVGTPVISGH